MTDQPKKRIILCSDGTGNSVVKNRGTNVWKTFESIDVNGHRVVSGDPSEPALTEQIAFYDDGVGTESVKLLKLLGGEFGVGLSRNVRELYTMLCRRIFPGDQIYLFGFSRGAHTARTVAGLISEHFRDVRYWVLLRRGMHLGLLLVTIGVLLVGGWTVYKWDSDWLTAVSVVIVLLLLLLVVYLIGAQARKKLEWTFSNWWRKALGLSK